MLAGCGCGADHELLDADAVGLGQGVEDGPRDVVGIDGHSARQPLAERSLRGGLCRDQRADWLTSAPAAVCRSAASKRAGPCSAYPPVKA